MTLEPDVTDGMDKQPAILIMGPTASGKTGLAIHLRERFPVDLISVDSALVYRDMDIGTAKPDAATLKSAPHALINLRNPDEAYSAADFRMDALAAMAEISSRGRVPVLVGGTMMYFRALLNGLAKLPPGNEKVRAQLELDARENGWPAMHRRLARHDRLSAEKIHPNDAQRIQRALEVLELTGQPMSELVATTTSEDFSYRSLKLVVCPDQRSTLHERIAVRFDLMIDAGLVDEVKMLRERYALDARLPSMRSVGYRQIWQMLEGESGAGDMREKALAATRQLAKRQLTWLRREEDAVWYDLMVAGAEQSIEKMVATFLEK